MLTFKEFSVLLVNREVRRWLDYKRVPKGFQQRKLKKTEENTAKMRLEQILMLQSGVYCGNLLRRHLLWCYLF